MPPSPNTHPKPSTPTSARPPQPQPAGRQTLQPKNPAHKPTARLVQSPNQEPSYNVLSTEKPELTSHTKQSHDASPENEPPMTSPQDNNSQPSQNPGSSTETPTPLRKKPFPDTRHPRQWMKGRPTLQILILQEQIELNIKKPECGPRELDRLGRLWLDLEMLKRSFKQRPLPGVVSPSVAPAAPAPAFLEPTDEDSPLPANGATAPTSDRPPDTT